MEFILQKCVELFSPYYRTFFPFYSHFRTYFLNVNIFSSLELNSCKLLPYEIFYQVFLRSHPIQNVSQRLDLKLEENSIFYKLGSYGLISFSDYVFLLTVLSSEYDWSISIICHSHHRVFRYSHCLIIPRALSGSAYRETEIISFFTSLSTLDSLCNPLFSNPSKKRRAKVFSFHLRLQFNHQLWYVDLVSSLLVLLRYTIDDIADFASVACFRNSTALLRWFSAFYNDTAHNIYGCSTLKIVLLIESELGSEKKLFLSQKRLKFYLWISFPLFFLLSVFQSIIPMNKHFSQTIVFPFNIQ